MAPDKRVLNLGAGVQSTTLYLLSEDGELPAYDAAIFADTGEEPAPVYRHLDWLIALKGKTPIIIARKKTRLGDDLANGVNSTGQRFASIPAYTTMRDHEARGGLAPAGCEVGQTQRQCTAEYKVEVIEKAIREELFGLKARQRMPRGATVQQHFGISDDEGRRVNRIRARYVGHPWAVPRFPLVTLGRTRADCEAYLAKRVPHVVPKSACTFCPYRSAREWVWLRDNDPEGWNRAVSMERLLMQPTFASNSRGMQQPRYLHRSCIPLDMLPLDELAKQEANRQQQPDMFMLTCTEGFCGR